MESKQNLPNVQSVLYALSSGLSIRYIQTYFNPYTNTWDSRLCCRPAPADTQSLFKIQLQKLLDELVKKLNPSDYVFCSYSFGMIRGGTGDLVESITSEFQEAMSALPKLNKGEHYCFHEATSVCFEVTHDRSYKVDALNHRLSPWIVAKLFSK